MVNRNIPRSPEAVLKQPWQERSFDLRSQERINGLAHSFMHFDDALRETGHGLGANQSRTLFQQYDGHSDVEGTIHTIASAGSESVIEYGIDQLKDSQRNMITLRENIQPEDLPQPTIPPRVMAHQPADAKVGFLRVERSDTGIMTAQIGYLDYQNQLKCSSPIQY